MTPFDGDDYEIIPGFLNSDRLIALCDEVEIERDLMSAVKMNFLCDIKSYKTALDKIDKLKSNQTYTRERKKLLVRWKSLTEAQVQPLRAMFAAIKHNYMEDFANFAAGLESSDPIIRAEFQEVQNEMGWTGETPMSEMRAIVRIAKRVKVTSKRGRPLLSPPWLDEVVNLDQMRALCAKGSTAKEAATKVVIAEGSARNAEAVNRVKHLLKLYRQRMALRI